MMMVILIRVDRIIVIYYIIYLYDNVDNVYIVYLYFQWCRWAVQSTSISSLPNIGGQFCGHLTDRPSQHRSIHFQLRQLTGRKEPIIYLSIVSVCHADMTFVVDWA